MSDIDWPLEKAGKTTFVACFEARQNSGSDLSSSQVKKLCRPDSLKWTPGSLATKTRRVNQIFGENRQCEALRICRDAKRLPRNETKQKARELYEQFCVPAPQDKRRARDDARPRRAAAPHVTRSVRGGVATVEFFHPAHNSLPGGILAQLADAIDAVGADDGARVVVLRGGGDGVFCAGASFDELAAIAGVDAGTDTGTDTVADAGGDTDIDTVTGAGGDAETGTVTDADGDTVTETGANANTATDTGADAGARFFAGFARVINAMRRCPKFIVVRVHGKAVGGGVGLAAAADYALASSRATVKLSELSVGLGPFVVGPAVARKIGASAFAQLAIDAESFYPAEWAREKGLYAQVFDSPAELDAAVAKLAARLAAYHPAAMRELKRALWEDAADWEEKLAARAALSGRLAASDFTARAVREFKRRRG